jgi:hypothetical protein
MALEDYTTYTEEDPSGNFSVSANSITITNLEKEANAWVVDSKGSGHFDADFSHDFEYTPEYDSGPNSSCEIWTLANQTDDLQAIQDESDDALSVMNFNGTSSSDIRIYSIESNK